MGKIFFNVCTPFCHQETGNYNYLFMLLNQQYTMSKKQGFLGIGATEVLALCPYFSPLPHSSRIKGSAHFSILQSYVPSPHPTTPTPASWGTHLNHILHVSWLYKLTF